MVQISSYKQLIFYRNHCNQKPELISGFFIFKNLGFSGGGLFAVFLRSLFYLLNPFFWLQWLQWLHINKIKGKKCNRCNRCNLCN